MQNRNPFQEKKARYNALVLQGRSLPMEELREALRLARFFQRWADAAKIEQVIGERKEGSN